MPAISDDEKSEPDQDSAASSPPKKGREKKAVSYIEIKEDEPEADTVHTNGDSGEDDDGDDDGELEEDECARPDCSAPEGNANHSHRYVVEKILSHIIADDVSTDRRLSFSLAPPTNTRYSGSTPLRGKMGGIREEVGPDMGTRREPPVSRLRLSRCHFGLL